MSFRAVGGEESEEFVAEEFFINQPFMTQPISTATRSRVYKESVEPMDLDFLVIANHHFNPVLLLMLRPLSSFLASVPDAETKVS